ncbi:hypothetical protein [Streptomyces sp. NPDC001260]|uniref:hypothetical protein n=1 Tax=Streptomyces sp. NPDC001260 TaxID=3364551 RepID=UPI0036AA69CB
MTRVRCPSPTCRKLPLQEFTDLEGAEVPAAAAVMLPELKGEQFVAKAFHRCRHDGCRRIQKKTMWWIGGYLPEGF